MTETFKHTRAITFEINSKMTIVYDMFAVRALHDWFSNVHLWEGGSKAEHWISLNGPLGGAQVFAPRLKEIDNWL